ncbi:MAG: sulfotransferase [Hyphomicrobiales bacterium]|nr:sulfotransferase [Hyphomicrobiales bacterium]
MAKSRRGRTGSIPVAAMAQRLGGLGRAVSLADLLPRAKPASDLESFLAKDPVVTPKSRTPGAPGLPSGGPKSSQISLAEAREANRLACEGARLIHQGRQGEAIPLLQRSVKLDPSVWASHYDLGVAMTTAGLLEQAIEPFAAALRLNPGLASAHNYFACIFDSMGQESRAMASYHAAVALQPNLVIAQMRLGVLYLTQSRNAEAEAAFRAAASAAPGTRMARIAEACALEASSALDEALAAACATVEAYPKDAEAHAYLAKLLDESGLSAEAAAHYLRATELAPDLCLAWSGLARNRKFTGEDSPLIARMNAVLARPNLTPRKRQVVHFALGKAHDDMGNYEAAILNFEAGNRLRAMAGDLDRAELVRRVDRLIEATPQGYRDRQPDPGVEDATPILIVGMPRSGSTLTEQILSSHPEVAAGGELEFWHARDTPREDVWGLNSEATRRFADDYLARLRRFGPGAKRVTDKALDNFLRLGFIHRILPKATFIHCRRHPVDTALSIFTTNFDCEYGGDRGDLVFFFRQYQRLMAHWRQVLPPDRLIDVDYEELVADPEPQARRLIAACGLEWNDACLAPHCNTRTIQTASLWQARQPVYKTSVGRWRRYELWLGEFRELLSAKVPAP